MGDLSLIESSYKRYAVYYVPRQGEELAQFGCDWLGVDAENGLVSDAPTPFVESPRRYGFHATLKAPMRLSQSSRYGAFRSDVEALAAILAPVTLGRLRLKRIGQFLALVADDHHEEDISTLAWKCVTELDHHRSELNEAERNKRTNLTISQTENLNRWGYPYVGSEFRFHMTLTSAMTSKQLDEATNLLDKQIPDEPMVADSICIFGDPGEAKPFELVERFDLTG